MEVRVSGWIIVAIKFFQKLVNGKRYRSNLVNNVTDNIMKIQWLLFLFACNSCVKNEFAHLKHLKITQNNLNHIMDVLSFHNPIFMSFTLLPSNSFSKKSQIKFTLLSALSTTLQTMKRFNCHNQMAEPRAIHSLLLKKNPLIRESHKHNHKTMNVHSLCVPACDCAKQDTYLNIYTKGENEKRISVTLLSTSIQIQASSTMLMFVY